MSELENVKEAILNFCNGMDAIITKLRKDLHAETVAFKRPEYHNHLNPPADRTKPEYDVMKIVWTDAQGQKGSFLLAKEEGQMSDENKRHFNILREALKAIGGSMFGKEIIWLFKDEKAIGRKKKA